ncbi:trichohyalin-like isoform X2 [Pecten maximus]|uniref:trichohyalin-like isoform X2 n=1 Tax=Pecten maximus TaxID=6579 RepID=UPI0014582BF4|nr:trichohyalin-like isoform X2 [Pecten maximus]
MSYRAAEDRDDDDYSYSDDSFISEDEKPARRTESLNRTRKTTAPRKDDSRGRGRGKGRGKQRSTSQVTPRVDPVIQRVLSARKLRINELRNNMEDLLKQIEDMKEENKLLKKTQYRQEKALNRFEDRESDLPQIMQKHNNETRAMRDQLKKTKEKYERTDRYLRDAEDELEKVKGKMKKYKRLVDENDLLERDELQTKVKKAEIDLEEKEVKIKDLERHVNNLSKNHRHELGIEMARTRDAKKQMDTLRDENDRLEKQLREKMKELEMKNIYANRMSKPGSRMMPNSYSGTPMRQSSPSSPRRRRPPSVHDLNPREKVKLYEERRKEEERKQRENTSPIPRLQFTQESKDYEKKRASKSKPTPAYRGGSFSPRKPVSTEPLASKKEDNSSKPWRSSRQVQSEKPRGSERLSDRQRPFLYNDKKSKADDKPAKLSWKADDSYGGAKTPSSRDYNEDFERAPSAGSKEWERIEEDTDDSYSKSYKNNGPISSQKSPRHETSTFTATGKKWPWESSSGNTYNNVSKKPSIGSTRVYASPPSGKSRYKSIGKKSTVASTSTYSAGESVQQQQKAHDEREARERERQLRQEQEEETERKERWEHMERVQRDQEERERSDREEQDRKRRQREEQEQHDREEQDRRDAEEWKMKLEREKMKREAEELRREQEERQRRERERKEQERRAEEERERIQKDKQMDEERRKKDLLLAKLRDIDDGKKTERDKSHDPFFLTNKADSDVASTSSSKKSYQFTKPIENLHHGKWSHEDVSVPYLEKQKKKKEKEDDGGYQPSFGRRGDSKNTKGKKTGDVVFNDDFAKPPKPKDNKKKDLMADLFGNQPTKKTNNTFNDDDIFSSSNFDTKKTNTAKLSLFDDEPKQTTTKRENSLSLFGGGSALLDDDTTTTNDSSKLLPRRQRHTTTTFQSRPVVNAAENNFDDDIEEVIL